MDKINTKYQQVLKDLKLYDGAIDGLYGPKTKAATKAFQRMNGLKADGIIGPMTSSAFNEQIASIPGREEGVQYAKGKGSYDRWPVETTSSLMKYYGDVGKSQVSLDVPYQMYLAWDTSKKIRRFSCHSKVADSLYRVLNNVKHAYSENEIKKYGFDMFGGCLNVRKIRGGNRWSTHAWGIAVDLDPARNGLRTPWHKSGFGRPECIDFVNAFKEEGWYSLGLEKNYDSMHFQACHR